MAHDTRIDVPTVMGGSTRDAVRTLAATYELTLAEAARVFEGEANASVHDRDRRAI